MSTWKTRGLRGSALENIINRTNELYMMEELALVQKIPTPITPVEMNKNRQITLAYFNTKSTVDYIGAVQGIPICFDAKESATDTFSLQNIHEHQVDFMNKFEKQDGVAFFLINFTGSDRFYYMTLREMLIFYDRSKNGGRKSIRIEELDPDFFIEMNENGIIPYLNYVQKDIDGR
ncbi:MAG: Holliday junction resolvase RecU [Lachnospiraceae bacterium]|nr:Holliday junction resolvase RecU [Lachnospiraceae bacterium]